MTAFRAYFDDAANTRRAVWIMLGLAVALTLLRPVLPAGLVRIPESLLLPWRDWIDVIFQTVVFDWGFINFTRFLSSGLEFILDAVANVLYGKARWPRFEALPWTVLTGPQQRLRHWRTGRGRVRRS